MSVAAIGTWRLTRRASMLALINYRLSHHRSLKIMHLLARSRRDQSMMERVHRAMLVIQEFLDPYFKRLKRSLAVGRRSRLLTLNLMAVPMEHSTSSLRWPRRPNVPIRLSQTSPIRSFITKGRRRIYLCSLRT